MFSSFHLPTPRNQSLSQKQKINNQSSENNPPYCQPQMKFRARNDLERIKERVNLNYYGKLESKIIQNQLLAIKNKYKRNNRFNNSKLNPSTEEIERQKENEHIIMPTPKKKSTPKNYIHIIPKAVFLNNRGYKTHFKATESIALREKRLLESSFTDKKSSMFLYINAKANNTDDQSNQNVFNFEDKYANHFIKTKTLFCSQSQDSIYNMNRNPNKKRDILPDNIDYLSMLRQIAFTQREKEDLPKINQHQQNHEDLTRFEKKITIGNEEYGIQSQIKLIAEKVLNKCNIYNKKINTNLTFHGSKKGKLMMTSGLSIRDFLSKYHLPG